MKIKENILLLSDTRWPV